jgi:Planctomycete cytochrome C
MPPSRRTAQFPISVAGPMTPRARHGIALFGIIYLLMLAGGFAVGFQAGTPRPTPPTKHILVASNKPNTSTAKSDPVPSPQAEATPKTKAPEPKASESKTLEMKEPEPKTVPEPPPEPKPEPKKTPPPVKPAATELAFAKVAPILKDKCGGCHGGANAKGGLDLRSAKSAIAGGDNGEAVKPGDPDGSLLWQSISEGTMPPKNKPKLTEDEKKLIKEWIAGGAK